MRVLVCVADFCVLSVFLFFFNDTATTEIYTLSLHDALPIWRRAAVAVRARGRRARRVRLVVLEDDRTRRPRGVLRHAGAGDRKSTRLNSSHEWISYAVFCLKKKKHTLKYDDNNVVGDREPHS